MNRKQTWILVLAMSLGTGTLQGALGAELAANSNSLPAAPDSSLVRNLAPDRMAFDRGAEGGQLPSLTIEGEDQVSIRFERPSLVLDLQPRSAPGLDWENTWDKVDLFPVLTRFSALEQSPYLGRPWLDTFAAGEVVVFRPRAEGVRSWRLDVVDSRGRLAMSRHGNGRLPESIAWDGRRQDGTPAWPGLTYTHVLETTDKAGNTRTVTGESFELPPYRLQTEDGIQLVLAGEHFPHNGRSRHRLAEPDRDLILETASWLNQVEGIEGMIEIQVTARSNGQAGRLAEMVAEALGSHVIGPDDRITTATTVVLDAPDQGMVVISTMAASTKPGHAEQAFIFSLSMEELTQLALSAESAEPAAAGCAPPAEEAPEDAATVAEPANAGPAYSLFNRTRIDSPL